MIFISSSRFTAPPFFPPPFRIFHHVTDILRDISAENGGACHDHIRSRFQHGGDVLLCDSAVHLDVHVQSLFLDHPPGFPDPRRGRRKIPLAAEARLHGHDQKHVDLIQVFFHAADGRRRLDGQPGLPSQAVDPSPTFPPRCCRLPDGR